MAVTAGMNLCIQTERSPHGAGNTRTPAGTADGLVHQPDTSEAVMKSQPVVSADLYQPSLKRWHCMHAEPRHCANASDPDYWLRPSSCQALCWALRGGAEDREGPSISYPGACPQWPERPVRRDEPALREGSTCHKVAVDEQLPKPWFLWGCSLLLRRHLVSTPPHCPHRNCALTSSGVRLSPDALISVHQSARGPQVAGRHRSQVRPGSLCSACEKRGHPS